MYNNIFENFRFNPPFFVLSELRSARHERSSGKFEQRARLGFTPSRSPAYGLVQQHHRCSRRDCRRPRPRAIDQNLVTAYYEQTNYGFQYEIA